MMNKTIYLILTFLTLFSCNENSKEKSDKNLTEISLKLVGYNSSQHKSFIDLTIENLINPIHKQLKISDSGIANYSFINHKKTELIFSYNNRKFNLIASPNEKIQVAFNIKELLENSKLKDFTITGKNAKTNKLILAYSFYLDSLINQSSDAFSRNGKTPEINFKKARISEMENQLDVFRNFVVQNNIKDKTFMDWATAQIRYSAGYDLSIYPYYGPINRDLSIDSQYYTFIDEIAPSEKGEILYQTKLKYLKILSTSLKIMSTVSAKYNNKRRQLEKDSISNFPILYEIIKQLPKNKNRDLIMAFAFKNNRVPISFQDSLQYVLSDNLINQIKQEEKIQNKPITVLIKEYDISEKEKSELLKIYEKNKGKVIFHDFWFANCGNCLAEFPYYNDLIKSTAKENVAFIFYGTYMNEHEWERTRKKYDLKGEHYLLSKDQLAFFEKYFGVRGYPHHQMVNSKGKIVKEKITSVFPENFEKIKELINKNNGA